VQASSPLRYSFRPRTPVKQPKTPSPISNRRYSPKQLSQQKRGSRTPPTTQPKTPPTLNCDNLYAGEGLSPSAPDSVLQPSNQRYGFRPRTPPKIQPKTPPPTPNYTTQKRESLSPSPLTYRRKRKLAPRSEPSTVLHSPSPIKRSARNTKNQKQSPMKHFTKNIKKPTRTYNRRNASKRNNKTNKNTTNTRKVNNRKTSPKTNQKNNTNNRTRFQVANKNTPKFDIVNNIPDIQPNINIKLSPTLKRRRPNSRTQQQTKRRKVDPAKAWVEKRKKAAKQKSNTASYGLGVYDVNQF